MEAAMAKLVLSMFLSLDGYVEGPNGQFIPPAWSDDFGRHWAQANLERASRLLYGRTNFEFNKTFWTDPEGPAAGAPHAAVMNSLPKTWSRRRSKATRAGTVRSPRTLRRSGG